MKNYTVVGKGRNRRLIVWHRADLLGQCVDTHAPSLIAAYKKLNPGSDIKTIKCDTVRCLDTDEEFTRFYDQNAWCLKVEK